jgi:hypothetical protein
VASVKGLTASVDEMELPENANTIGSGRNSKIPPGAFPAFICISSIKQKGGTNMSFSDCKDMELWEATRRKFLKILALTGTVLSVDLLGPLKSRGFGKGGSMTLEEMRQEAMQVFGQPKLFM